MTTGERIKKIRKHYGLTLEKFGKKIGITKASLSRIESGTNNPSDQTIMLICREYNVNEDWLRNGTGDMFNPLSESGNLIDQLAAEYTLDDFQRKLLTEYLSLTPAQKSAVKTFLNKLYNEPDKTSTPDEHNELADIPAAQLIDEINARNTELAKRELSSSKETNII